MKNYAGPLESLDATKKFIGRALGMVCHQKKKIENADERSKAMNIQLKNMKIEKTKKLEMALASKIIVVQTKNKTSKEEKKSVEDILISANEELTNLKKIVARLKGELHDKDKAQFDLMKQKLIVTNHQEGFKKAQSQVAMLLPDFDYKRIDVNCDLLDGEIIRESQLCSDEEEEEEKNEVDSTMVN
ncbi:hypothetical protein HKD37_05G012701 [Glycine soja]